MQAEIDALRRELADALKRIAKLEAWKERSLAQSRIPPAELVNQTFTREPIQPDLLGR